MWEIPILIIPFFVTLLSYYKKNKVKIIQIGRSFKINKIKLILNKNEAWLYLDVIPLEFVSNIDIYTYVDGRLLDINKYNYTLEKKRTSLTLLVTDKLPPLEHEVRIDVFVNNKHELTLLYRYYYPLEIKSNIDFEEIIPSLDIKEILPRIIPKKQRIIPKIILT